MVSVPLPDEGAAEMVGELHDANPSVPVLVLTRAGDPQEREAFLRAGASEVLSKECTFAQIREAVRRLGAKRRGPIHWSAWKGRSANFAGLRS